MILGERDVPSSCGFASVEEETAIVAVSSRAISGLDRVMCPVVKRSWLWLVWTSQPSNYHRVKCSFQGVLTVAVPAGWLLAFSFQFFTRLADVFAEEVGEFGSFERDGVI